jgi:ubiquinone/menaquinone biosynthesis C-methylase UbiE
MDNFIRRLISPPEKKISRFVRSGSVAADLGCGPGYFTVPMAKLVGQNGKVYAVDSDAKSIRKLRQKTDPKLQGVIEASTGSAAHVDMVPDRSVDFVLANGLLCCMSDHKGAIAEIKRILKAKGIAYFSVSKLCRRNDAKAVRQEEWDSILENFEVIERNESVLSRWAVVSLRS